MEINDLYSDLIFKLRNGADLSEILSTDMRYGYFLERATELRIDLKKIGSWMVTSEYLKKFDERAEFADELLALVKFIEAKLNFKLTGTVILGPSLRKIDGFARFDYGQHCILIGPDHPRCDSIYLRVLLAHELSHVYREQLPAAVSRFGKPLREVSRQDYLSSFSLREHLASEGLAVLFSKICVPGVEERYYTFHSEFEANWCKVNEDRIQNAVRACSRSKSQDVWNLYNKNVIDSGSAPWAHYYWAAKQIELKLANEAIRSGREYSTLILESHAWSAEMLIDL